MSFGSFGRRGQRDHSKLKISGDNSRVFQLWPLENRLFCLPNILCEEIEEMSSLFTTQFPVLISQHDLGSVNCLKKIERRIFVVKKEIHQGKKYLVSSKLLCSKDANLVVQIRSFVWSKKIIKNPKGYI